MTRLFSVIAALGVIAFIAAAPAHAQQNITMDLLKELYGLTSAPIVAETTVTVGTTPVRLRQANAARFELFISDTGTSNCSISTSNQVTITAGDLLVSGGGTLVEGFRDDGLLPTEEHWAVCAAAGGTLHVTELILG